MTAPSFDVSEDRRNPTGWVVLALIFSLLIAAQLVGYFKRGKGPDKYTMYETQLKLTLKTRRAMQETGQLAQVKDSISKGVEDPISDLAALRGKDEQAAMLYAVMRFVAGKQVLPEDVAILAKSKLLERREFAQVYASKSLSAEAARTLANGLKDKGFVYRVAGMQALERAGDPAAKDFLYTAADGYGLILLLYASAGLACVSTFLWVAYFVARGQGKLKPLGMPTGLLSFSNADRFAIRGAQGLGLFILASLILNLVLVSKSRADDPLLSTAVEAFFVVGCIFLTRTSLGGKKISLEAIGVTTHNLGINIVWGIGCAIAIGPVSMLLAAAGTKVLHNLPTPDNPITHQLAGGPLSVFLLGITAAVLAPFYEEFIFRGHLFPAFSSVWRSPVWGAIITSVLFAAIHPTGIPAWPALASVGAASCMLAYQTRSLVPSIVMHGIYNFTVLAMGLALQ